MSSVLYRELVWSVSINGGDFFVYEPATQGFLEFLKEKGIEAAADDEVNFEKIRRPEFVFHKGLRKELRQKYPEAMGIMTVFGEAEWVREPSTRKKERKWLYSLIQSWKNRLLQTRIIF